MNKIEFTFHGVGQGLFYSGKIHNFNFIYDCGSESKAKYLNDSIERYALENSNQINLLIISHFHLDHISGIFKLIQNHRIENLVMPYFIPAERLLIASNNPSRDQKYKKFLSDPIGFCLKQKNIRRITILRGSESKKNIQEHLENDNTENLNFGLLGRNKDFENLIKENEPNVNLQRVLIRESSQWLGFKKLWGFKFFNSPINKSKYNLLKKRLTKIKIEKPINIISKIHNDKIKLKKIKKIYALVKPDLNDTSLVLLHKPIYD